MEDAVRDLCWLGIVKQITNSEEAAVALRKHNAAVPVHHETRKRVRDTGRSAASVFFFARALCCFSFLLCASALLHSCLVASDERITIVSHRLPARAK